MYTWTTKYVGIPFASGGRDRAGCDCYGLVRLVLHTEYGYTLPEYIGDYNNALSLDETKNIFKAMVPLLCADKIAGPQERAVALIKMRGLFCHVALYAGGGYIIHAKDKVGVVCERLDSPALAGIIGGWYRVDKSYRIP